MAGWFSRIIKGGEPTEAEPVEFVLTCRCGQTVTGIRGRRMQVAVCRACTYQICVLPCSPYPRPKVRTPKKPAKPLVPKRPPRATQRVMEDDDEPRTPPPLPKRTGRVDDPPGKKSTNAKRSVQGPQKGQAAPPRDDFQPLAIRRKIVTPLRLAVVGMVAVISLAGWWVWHQRAISKAIETFAVTTKAGRSALAASEFDRADQQLRLAVAALDLLKRDDREARQVRQQAREAAAANGLSMISLFELLGEARQTQKMAGNDWQKILKQSYLGDWFLFDSNAFEFASGDPPKWTFTLPLVSGSETIQVQGDLTKWSKQIGAGERPTQFVLAGKLSEIRAVGSGGNAWEIVLDGDSICLWTDPVAYAALGGSVDEATVATLKSQAQILGVAE